MHVLNPLLNTNLFKNLNRELGTSKMNGSIFGEAVLGVIQLKLGSWFRKYPQKKTV